MRKILKYLLKYNYVYTMNYFLKFSNNLFIINIIFILFGG